MFGGALAEVDIGKAPRLAANEARTAEEFAFH